MNNGWNDYIQWTRPAGVQPTGYRLTYSSTGGDGSVALSGTTTTWHPTESILFGRYYTVSVQAVSGSWASAPGADTPRIIAYVFLGVSC